MADTLMKKELAQADVAAIKVPGKYRFAPGLYLQVGGPDAKSWIYRFTLRDKERAWFRTRRNAGASSQTDGGNSGQFSFEKDRSDG